MKNGDVEKADKYGCQIKDIDHHAIIFCINMHVETPLHVKLEVSIF